MTPAQTRLTDYDLISLGWIVQVLGMFMRTINEMPYVPRFLTPGSELIFTAKEREGYECR